MGRHAGEAKFGMRFFAFKTCSIWSPNLSLEIEKKTEQASKKQNRLEPKMLAKMMI